MRTETKQIALKTWLFSKPAKFALWMLIPAAIFLLPGMLHLLNKPAFMAPTIVISTLLVSTIVVYRLIKSLPHVDVSRNDFVAITNGYKIISLVLICALVLYNAFMKRVQPADMFPSPEFAIQAANHGLVVVSRFVFDLLTLIQFILGMYLLGVVISNICIRYKRARIIGFASWQIILSMPFTFLMTWIHGYLGKDNSQTSNLKIRAKWYAKFNDWVLKNTQNTYFVFLMLILFSNAILTADIPTLLFPLIFVLIYELWKKQCKTDFKKCINRGYAWIAVIVNICMLMYVIHSLPISPLAKVL